MLFRSGFHISATFYDHRYEILSTGQKAEIRIDGKNIGIWNAGVRVITEETGEIINIVKIE